MIIKIIKGKRTLAGAVRYLEHGNKSTSRNRAVWRSTRNCTGLSGDDDPELAVACMEATAACNTRAKNKFGHLVVSFATGEAPDKSTCEEIAATLLQKLGAAQHEAYIVAHDDTANFHFHIVYGKIHPTTYKALATSNDYHVCQEVAKQMERKYKLQPAQASEAAQAVETDTDASKIPNSAADAEAYSGEESLVRYCQENVRDKIAAAKTWNDAHAIACKHGLSIQKAGGGAVLKELRNFKAVKLSSVGREITLGKLEERLGKFTAPKIDSIKTGEQKKAVLDIIVRAKTWQELHDKLNLLGIAVDKRGKHLTIRATWNRVKLEDIATGYTLGDLQSKLGKYDPCDKKEWRDVQRTAAGELWDEYLARKESDAAKREHIKETISNDYAKVSNRLRRYYSMLWKLSALSSNRKRSYERIKRQKAASYKVLNDAAAKRRRDALVKHAPMTWNDFLVEKAMEGNELALESLRKSKRNEELLSQREKYTTWLEAKAPPPKKNLLDKILPKIISRRGAVVYNPKQGVSIIDEGDHIRVNCANAKDLQHALLFVRRQFGENLKPHGSPQFIRAANIILNRGKMI